MIIDAFPFFNELDLLEIRLNELSSIVDCFVVCESKKTFSNKEKPLFFQENLNRFKDFKSKIIHLVVESLPEGDDPWVREHAQRKTIIKFFDRFHEDSVCMLSDADEIPSVESIKSSLSILEKQKIVLIKHFFCHGYLNRILVSEQNGFWAYWGGTRIAKKSFWDKSKMGREYEDAEVIGGWHFRNIGDAKSLCLKLKSYSHHKDVSRLGLRWEEVSEDHIKTRMESGKELCQDGFNSVTIPENFLPNYVLSNKDKFKSLLHY
jgi:beta-1,4-mannosyl-glycoprotein beta-1,4-N-acetylglucosaminyltransferase